MRVSIIVPVHNEAKTLPKLLARVRSQAIPGADKEIIIVESGSTDGSRDIVAEFLAHDAGDESVSLRAVYEPEARGKGHAVRQGFGLATGDILMIQDADLEYDTADYPRLLGPIIQGHAAFVMGSRHLGPERWNIRKFSPMGLRSAWTSGWMNLGGALFHGFFNLLFGTHLSDPTSMFKVFRADCLEGLRFSCNRFDFDFELLGKLLRAGFVPLEVPVSYNSRGFDAGKKIRMLRDPPGWVWAILKCRFATLGREAAPVGRYPGKRRYSKKPAIRPSL